MNIENKEALIVILKALLAKNDGLRFEYECIDFKIKLGTLYKWSETFYKWSAEDLKTLTVEDLRGIIKAIKEGSFYT